MKPSESHKQPTFVIPKNPFQEVGFVGDACIVCTAVVFTVKMRPITELRPVCRSALVASEISLLREGTTAEWYFISAGSKSTDIN